MAKDKKIPRSSKKAEESAASSKSSTAKTKGTIAPLLKSENVPATQSSITHLKKHVDKRIDSLELRMASFENKMDARFTQVDARFTHVDARFTHVDAQLNDLKASIANVLSEVHRIALLTEEQNARNKYVLEGYDQIFKRQDRLEVEVNQRLQNVEDIVSKKISEV